MCSYLFILFIIFTINSFVQSQLLSNDKNSNLCDTKTKCGDCLQMKGCAWCRQPDFGDKLRCFPLNGTISVNNNNGCDKKFIVNHKNEMNILIAENLTLKSNPSESMPIQITPQRINLKLRPNDPFLLDVKYSQATDYPLDLYYLMDLSQSMKDDKEKLSKLGNELSETMRNITSNFRLGFGSFVDKIVMPFVTISMMNGGQCHGCIKPYGFKNHLKLNTDSNKFSKEVQRAQISGNLDSPEGGFDGIMQAIVCRDEIGWREQSRKLLVFTTDASYHSAGDGKLAGIIEPNDGKCHLNEYGEYTHSTVLDFPSVSQLNSKVKENSVNLIFAVTRDQIATYERLSKFIEGSASAALSGDSSNVVKIVKDEYKKMTSSVELKDNATSIVKITYSSECLDYGIARLTNKCDGLSVGDVIKFTAEITVTSCPQDPKDWLQTIQIYPVGLNESLIINLEIMCNCPCERAGNDGWETSSKQCNKHGTYTCGICECDKNNFGRKCECSISDVFKENDSDRGCRPDNATTTDCNGRGNCECGVCQCDRRTNIDEVISGQFCECDNFSCDRVNNLLCSGSHNGICECGRCECLQGWTGSACDCLSSNETCIEPNSDQKICSGHGECDCGRCRCDSSSEGRYSGKYCEQCPTCSDRCIEFEKCVKCQMYKTGSLKENTECSKNCKDFQSNSVESISESLIDKANEHLCTFYDEDDCKFSFTYRVDDSNNNNNDGREKITVNAQKERKCPAKVLTLGVVSGVIGGIVFLGIGTLLLWKLLTTIHDRREFARFENERSKTIWASGNNPHYRGATTTFSNPTFSNQ